MSGEKSVYFYLVIGFMIQLINTLCKHADIPFRKTPF